MGTLILIHHGNFFINGNEENAFSDRERTPLTIEQGALAFQEMNAVGNFLKQELLSAEHVHINASQRCKISALMALGASSRIEQIKSYSSFIATYCDDLGNIDEEKVQENLMEFKVFSKEVKLSYWSKVFDSISSATVDSIHICFYNKNNILYLLEDLRSENNDGFRGVKRSKEILKEDIEDSIKKMLINHGQVTKINYSINENKKIVITSMESFSPEEIFMIKQSMQTFQGGER